MARRCPLTGKETRAGRTYTKRGRPKRLGGVGLRTTSKTKRKFKPNIQRVRAVVNGRVVRINVAAKAIRNGLVIKPGPRNWKPEEADATS